MANTDIAADYRKQLLANEKRITETEKLLAEIEPGVWGRRLKGVLYWLLVGVTGLIAVGFVVGAIFLQFDSSVIKVHVEGVDFKIVPAQVEGLIFIIRVLLLGLAVTFVLFTLALKGTHRKLFKLANVSNYLEDIIEEEKKRRDVLFKVLMELEGRKKENTTI